MKKGILTIISGFSGAGKGTLLNEMLKKYNNYSLSISATTRKPREGEIDGKSYFFKTKEEFEDMIREDAFIEYASYVGNYYGTPKSYVMDKLEKGQDVILEIEIQGALKVKEKYPEAMLIFISTPNALSLKERLEGRKTENTDQIKARLKRAAEEAGGMEKYDYILINDNLNEAVDNLHQLIQSQKSKVSYNINLIDIIKKDLEKEFLQEEK
jgi:guanylate kinase